MRNHYKIKNSSKIKISINKIIKMDCQSKSEKVKNLLKEILYNSLAQAIINLILTPHAVLKIFLIACVLASTGLASYLVIEAIMNFLDYGVTTTSRIIFQNPTLFPKVTFCNVNWFTTEYAYNLTQEGHEDGKAYRLSNNEKKKLGHSLEDILIRCKFNNFACNSSDFTWYFDENYGNCYTFNSGYDFNRKEKVELKKSTLVGLDFGLQLTLYVNVYEKLISDPTNIYGLGALIRIGNSSYLSDYSNGGIFIPPGSSSYISVEREFRSILPKPYSNCEIDSPQLKLMNQSYFYDLISQSDYAYSQNLCFSECLQNYFIEKYNCTLYIFVSLFNVSLCEYDAYLKILESDDAFKNNFINDVCRPLCPLECNQTLYKPTLTSYQLIGDQFLEKVSNNSNLTSDFITRTLDSTQIEKSLIQVSIYYESLSYIFSEETPRMNMVTLLASIGGNLGLFLGVSVFSLYEMVEVAIEMYFIQKDSKKSSNQVEQNPAKLS
jgi:hypothetical protein